MNLKQRGYLGEKIALEFLKRKGYALFCQNYTIQGGEIDLIVWREGVLVFVEVKTRRSSLFGSGMESITSRKKQTLRRTMHHFLQEHRLALSGIRFDLIEVTLDVNDRTKNIEHFEEIELY